MQQKTTPRSIQSADAGHFLLGPRQVDLAGVLHEQGDLLLGQALHGAGDVRLKHFVEGNLFIVKEAIGGLHFGPSATSGRNAQIRPTAQRPQQRSKRACRRSSPKSASSTSSLAQGEFMASLP